MGNDLAKKILTCNQWLQRYNLLKFKMTILTIVNIKVHQLENLHRGGRSITWS